MQDPFLLGLRQKWWHKIWIYLLRLWRRKHLPQLPQACSNDPAEAQARELERILGGDYQCRTVFRYRGVSAEERLKELERGITVVLLAMEPFPSGVRRSMLVDAQAQLQKRQQKFLEAPLLSTYPDYVEVYLEAIRITLLEQQLPAGAYAIVLLMSKDAKNWSQSELDLDKSFFQFVEKIADRLSFSVPVYRAMNHPSALAKLEIFPEVTDILYGFPSSVCSSMEEKPQYLEQNGYRLHSIPSFNRQPSFIRALAEIIWDQTDNHPSKSVS